VFDPLPQPGFLRKSTEMIENKVEIFDRLRSK
jgi:hypothetical protein